MPRKLVHQYTTDYQSFCRSVGEFSVTPLKIRPACFRVALPTPLTSQENMLDQRTQSEIHTDFLQLARIALSGRTQDVHVVLRRAVKRYYASEPRLAEALTTLLHESPTAASPLRQADIPLPVDTDSRLHLLRVEPAPELNHEPILSPPLVASLTQIIEERRNPEALLRAGLEPTRTALFVGPPGVGKTMAARWLAREMRRPLLILDLAAVMSSLLGRTGSNLRHVLEYAKSLNCVLLLDELDAIAKRRDDTGEIGELKRLVTVLIQQIDDWPSSGVLLAATNHPDLLDPAIWRRFDLHVEFPLPDRAAISRFIDGTLTPHFPDAPKWSELLAATFSGRSFSDIERALTTARRSAALGRGRLEDHLTAFVTDRSIAKKRRIDIATNLVEQGLVSQRKAGAMTGVARDTIRNRAAAKRKRQRLHRNVAK
jgi:Cdc6-like AAA superfamily ATPase